MNPVLRTKLSIMMFLQYFIWGAWGVVIFTYISNLPTSHGLYFPGGYVGWIASALPIGAMVSPIFVGLFVDRLFPTERVLAALHIIGAILIGLAAWFCDQNLPKVEQAFDNVAKETSAGDRNVLEALQEEDRLKKEVEKTPDDKETKERLETFQKNELEPGLAKVRAAPQLKAAVDQAFWSLLICLLGYAICFMPTITLTNSISFRNISDPDKYFGSIRVLGTIGWIVAGVVVAFALEGQGASSQPLYLASAFSFVLGIFCLFLPHTPPAKEQKSLGDALGLPALAMLKNYAFLVFFICSFLVSVALSFYYQQANPFLTSLKLPYPTALQTIGQVSEIFFMLLIPIGLAKLGTKWMLSIGYLAWVIRYLSFATMSVVLVLGLGIPLHGVCFDFFFVVSFLYVDRCAPKHLRATAQSMITFVVLGLGWVLGNVLAGEMTSVFKQGAGVNWHQYWLVPMVGSAAAMVLFVLLFRETKTKETATPATP